MKDSNNDETGTEATTSTFLTGKEQRPTGLHGRKPALQVICLGNGGGPSEENVTGFLVRSIGSQWAKGSLLAVDAGSHLAPITHILERDFPSVSRHGAGAANGNGAETPGLAEGLARQSLSPAMSQDSEDSLQPEPTILDHGPFAGLELPNASARANALHVLRAYISTYLITHPHLDHISGFTVNTAAFHATSRPKTLAALPSTVDAIKTHIFNDVIWPNLSDEDGGVGFVTFQRLKEGGDVMVGEGEGRGYIEVCEGLGVKAFKVSHGVCTKSPPSHHHRGSVAGLPPSELQPAAYNSQMQDPSSRTVSISNSYVSGGAGTPGPVPGLTRAQSFYNGGQPSPRMTPVDNPCVVDSTAYFLRDSITNREVLIFGDVEPDSISLSPRNHVVWTEAARKIAYGCLGGIFIECSYDDSQADAVLFGHLNPKHLVAELQNLSRMVVDARAQRLLDRGVRKRKRSGPNGLDFRARQLYDESDEHKRSRSLASRTGIAKETRRGSAPDQTMSDVIHIQGVPSDSPTSAGTPREQHAHAHFAPWDDSHDAPMSPRTGGLGSAYQHHNHHPLLPLPHQHPHQHQSPLHHAVPHSSAGGGAKGEAGAAAAAAGGPPPLHGVKVVIIHIKDTMKDGPHVSENILAQLNEYEAGLRDDGQALGCEFVVSQSGESYWL